MTSPTLSIAPAHFVREYVYSVQPRRLYRRAFRSMTDADSADLRAAIKLAQTAWLSRVRKALLDAEA